MLTVHTCHYMALNASELTDFINFPASRLEWIKYSEAFITKEMVLKANVYIMSSQYQCVVQDSGAH